MAQWQVKIPRQAGLYVRSKREELGLTRLQVAQRAGVSERLLAALELGDAPGIRLDKLLAILHALDLSLFVGGEDNAPKEDTQSSTSSKRGESATRQDGLCTSVSTRAAYDELYRAFVQGQGAQWSGSTDFEGRG